MKPFVISADKHHHAIVNEHIPALSLAIAVSNTQQLGGTARLPGTYVDGHAQHLPELTDNTEILIDPTHMKPLALGRDELPA
jgi:hypothetical protein